MQYDFLQLKLRGKIYLGVNERGGEEVLGSDIGAGDEDFGGIGSAGDDDFGDIASAGDEDLVNIVGAGDEDLGGRVTGPTVKCFHGKTANIFGGLIKVMKTNIFKFI